MGILDSSYIFKYINAENRIFMSMEHAGFKARLMRAERLTGEHVHGLPPGKPLPVLPLAMLPGAPADWVREAGSYVCPVDSNWGLWFDWRENDQLNTAVMASVKGMNPVTGQKLDHLGFEQYADKCPVHDEPFAHGRICQKCGYAWPPQNYVAHPNTLWWDGFRQPNGSVRQFFFTDEEKRDVASAVIGKANTVPAFGFAFRRLKTPRTPPSRLAYRTVYGDGVMGPYVGDGQPSTVGVGANHFESTCISDSQSYTVPVKKGGSSMVATSAEMRSRGRSFPLGLDTIGNRKKGMVVNHSAVARSMEGVRCSEDHAVPEVELTLGQKKKEVAVGAGARIRQDLIADPLGVDAWRDEPDAVIRLYFCFEFQFIEMLKAGIVDLKNDSEGYLKGLPVG